MGGGVPRDCSRGVIMMDLRRNCSCAYYATCVGGFASAQLGGRRGWISSSQQRLSLARNQPLSLTPMLVLVLAYV